MTEMPDPRPDPPPAPPAAGGGDPALPAPPTPEADAPMLDVHPLHRPPHGWREFLLHIATIAVGLLLALGLEQVATYVHHRFELATARQELALEVAGNDDALRRNEAWAQALGAALRADVALLRAPQPPAGRSLGYPSAPVWPPDGAWQTAKRSGSIGLMPHDELDRYTYLYETVQAVKDSAPRLVLQLERAQAIAARSPDAALSPREAEELLAVTTEAQAELGYFERILHYEAHGLALARGGR